jgi:hypothetical protein
VTWLLIQIFFLIGFPALLAASSAWLSWNALLKPWRYVLVCCIALYVLYALVIGVLGPKTVGYIVSTSAPGEAAESTPVLVFLEPYIVALMVFTVTALPLIWFLLRHFKTETP